MPPVVQGAARAQREPRYARALLAASPPGRANGEFVVAMFAFFSLACRRTPRARHVCHALHPLPSAVTAV